MHFLEDSSDCTYSVAKKSTLTNAVLGEKSARCHEVDATTDHVSGGESRPVCFSSALAAEGFPVISMVCPAIRLPAGKLFQ